MTPSRRSAASEDSILASLERGSSSTRTHRGWLIAGGAAAAVLTLMIAWLAYGNATSVRALPQSAVKRPAAPPTDDGMRSQPLPSISIPAAQAAAIVDDPSADPPARPALVMLPREELAPLDERLAALPAEERVSRQPAAAKPAPRQVVKASKPPAAKSDSRTAAARKPKAPAAAPAAGAEVDSDVALLSAILAHSTRHAAERAQQEQESCQGKKCAPKPSGQP